ncbi:hypothetical protein ACH5RR_032021 [Cinchona calisaya]|uniref:Uncharacterized protein n=1 Tax=Cinchona calisaya TaxID=153742 RepID=A0ABD2YGW4_9GENT
MPKVDHLNAILAQHRALQTQLSTIAKSLINVNVNAVNAMSNHNLGACESCGGNHIGGSLEAQLSSLDCGLIHTGSTIDDDDDVVEQ